MHVHVQDRYETYKAPTAMPVQDWYRTFFWSAMVSGGHATYGGIQTWLPYQSTPVCAGVGRPCAGVRGYADLVSKRVLVGGARDLKHLSSFFQSRVLTQALRWRQGMTSLVPGHGWCGGNAERAVCAAAPSFAIVYIKRGVQRVAVSAPPMMPLGRGQRIRMWTFNPVTGVFVNDLGSEVVVAPLPLTFNVSCPSLSGLDCVVVFAPV